MPEGKRFLKVFLSYASQDQSVVRELSGRLASEGWIDPWVDAKKLLPGQDWRTKIEEAVETSDIVIVVLSNNSVAKEGYVQKELRFAQEIALEKPDETIFLIPLRLDDCNVPRGLRFFQWVDYFGDKKEESFSALIESFQLRYQQVLKSEEERAKKEKERRERELAEKLAREKVEREFIEKLTQEKAAREAAEKAAREMAEREAAEITEREREEKAKQEKLAREATEKANREKAEREASEKAAKEAARSEAAESAKRERAERRIALITSLRENVSRSFNSLKSNIPGVFSKLRIVSLFGIAIAVFWFLLNTPFKPASLPPTSTPSATITPIPLTKTHISVAATTGMPIWIPSFTPTITLTPTPVPTSSILLLEDFEDRHADGWKQGGGDWTVKKDTDGNYYLLVYGTKNVVVGINYGYRDLNWTDYAFESRIKFVDGPHNLRICVRGNCSAPQNLDSRTKQGKLSKKECQCVRDGISVLNSKRGWCWRLSVEPRAQPSCVENII